MIWVFVGLLIGYIIGTVIGYMIGYKFGVDEVTPKNRITYMIRKTPVGDAVERSDNYTADMMDGKKLWITANEN